MMPSQMTASYPGTPASETVGTSGRTVERTLPEVPSALSFPACTLGAIVGIASNIICTCPPRMSVRAPELPLYGT
jgi:hypothetical protein